MGDFDVDMPELRQFAITLDGVMDATAATLQIADVSTFATGIPDSESARTATATLSPAWGRLVESTVTHMTSHPATLRSVAEAYLRNEENASREIRHFFEGRVR